MNISAEQIQAIEQGEAVELAIHGTRCVVLRQDIYERVKLVLEPSPRETYPAVLKALDRDDESPEQYLEYLNE